MSLTRKKLKAIGLNEEQIESVIEDHTETLKGLQGDVEKYKADAEKLPSLQKELDDLKKTAGGEDYKAKYEKEHSDFEAYKNAQNAKETKDAKQRAYRDVIKAAGVSEKRIDAVLRVSDLDELLLDESGKPTNSEAITKKIKEEFSDFIVTKTETGAEVMTPPEGDGEHDLGKLDMAAYIAARKKSQKG